MRAAAGIILQARLASTRLPGKALLTIGRWSILEHCLRRLMAAGLPRVVLATTDRPQDDRLAAIAEAMHVPVFRGSENDVLDRFVHCASAFAIDPVIRATADNPAVDLGAAARLAAAIAETRADHVSEHGLPYGGAVEAVSAAALGVASRIARDSFDREHVTTFIRRRRDLFKVIELPAPAAVVRPDLRLTVDTPEDLQWIRELYARAGGDMPSLPALIDAAAMAREGAA